MTSPKNEVTPELLARLFVYDPASGAITWRVKRSSAKPGQRAGYLHRGSGYHRVRVNGRNINAHRVAWALHYGRWPTHFIDHINGDRSDNRIDNLREADHSQNAMNKGVLSNNTTGAKGVTRLAGGRFQAQIGCRRRTYYLGVYTSVDEAAKAYATAVIGMHGDYANTGVK